MGPAWNTPPGTPRLEQPAWTRPDRGGACHTVARLGDVSDRSEARMGLDLPNRYRGG